MSKINKIENTKIEVWTHDSAYTVISAHHTIHLKFLSSFVTSRYVI